MGIRGLFTYIKDNQAYDIIDLVKEAQHYEGLEILIDFNAYQRDLIEMLTRRIAKEYDNPFLVFPGGEFDIFYKAFYDFQLIFESIGIKLVWIIDGPRGVDEVASDQKQETWMKRDKQDIKQCDTVLSGCNFKLPPHDLNNLMPLCSFELVIDALKKAGAEIIQLLQGESDEFIAYEFHRRKSYAIITNDTDFVIFENCKVIFPRLMNVKYNKDDFNLPYIDNDNPGQIFKKPDNFNCPITSQNKILNLFQFDRPDQLSVLSILKGNDNTSEFSNELHYNLKITNSPTKNVHVTHIADYIRKHGLTMNNIRKYPDIMICLKKWPKLKDSIDFCGSFYSLKRIEENIQKSLVTYKPNIFKNQVTDYLARKLSNTEIWKGLYSMHFGTACDSINIEIPSDTCDSISTIMDEINSRIYPYILIESLNQVTLWRSRESKFVTVPVRHAALKINQIKFIKDGNLGDNIGFDIFDKIWSNLEPSGSLKYFQKFGVKCGFICYILRYFHQITKNKNLKLSLNEFQSLFVTVFYHYSIFQGETFNTKLKRDTFLQMKICPTAKCLISNVWFLRIFCSAKFHCGGAFNLVDEFPSVQNLINGSVFYAFYECIMNDTNDRISHLSSALQDSIKFLIDAVMKKYDVEYNTIIN